MIESLTSFTRRDVLRAGAASAIELGLIPQASAQGTP